MRFISCRAAYPPLGLLTVAGMLPESWELKLIDLNVSRLSDRDLAWAGYVLVGAMIVHQQSGHDIIHRCRAMGRLLIGGGTLFTTGFEKFGYDPHYVTTIHGTFFNGSLSLSNRPVSSRPWSAC